MRKVIVTEFITLDGVMEEPTLWQRGYSSPGIDQFKHDELFECGALLLGRVTYEEFVQYWPTATGTGDFGDRMNRLPKFVATTTLKSLEWNATALGGDLIAAMETLKAQEGENWTAPIGTDQEARHFDPVGPYADGITKEPVCPDATIAANSNSILFSRWAKVRRPLRSSAANMPSHPV